MASGGWQCSGGDDDNNGSVRASRGVRLKCVTGRQKRVELEQEVASLQKVLKDEEKVQEILERALLPSATRTTLNIPSFLPKKVASRVPIVASRDRHWVRPAHKVQTKELLAEFVMVEEEIARLEREISKIQQEDSSPMQSVKKDDLSMFNPHMTKNRGTNEKLALETGPMFFINQAMKGDYILCGFTGEGKNENPSENVKRRETQRKSGGVKQSSPKPPRNSSPRQSDASTEMLLKLLREPSSNISKTERNVQNWQPNKLSEKLLKCLICIFLRLIRTSRTSSSEPERSGNLLRSRSIQLQSGLSSKSSINFQKETGQQDPYGVFEIEDSLTRDIGPYKNLIRCTLTSLDLKNISSSLQLLGKLRDLMNNLRKVDLRFLSHHQKLAFWINIYNTCIMHGFLEHGLPTSPEKIVALKNKAVLNVGGNKLNALAIEHFILKQPSKRKEAYVNRDLDEREDAVRNIYGLEHLEPNIAFALCSGSRSSPSVKIYTADGVSSELEKSKLEFLQASLVVTASKRLMIPKLLESNMHEFATDLGSLVEWICNQLPTSGSLKKSMAECLKGLHGNGEISEVVDVLPYDFEFQYLLPFS